MEKVDVLVLGAGAAGLMCAIETGKRGRRTWVLDHANKAGKKILMSGGGRCNFTNLDVRKEHYISHNPKFCQSALSRYTPWDFIAWVEQHNIPYHEKTQGQLFCDHKSSDILNMLLHACDEADVTIKLKTQIDAVHREDKGSFLVETNQGSISCQSLVVATGGLSIPSMGASSFGYQLAKQFDIKVWPTRAGLVPFTLSETDKTHLSPLSGISMQATLSCQQQSFTDSLLITHRGLSGPACLQLSSYWQLGEAINIHLLPDMDLRSLLQQAAQAEGSVTLKSWLSRLLPKRLVALRLGDYAQRPLASCSNQVFNEVATLFQTWSIKPHGTEGYRTAEVTLGGVDVHALSSKTLQAQEVPGLYFIGEVVDVTGWLGGYNFQWAWSSGFAAGQVA